MKECDNSYNSTDWLNTGENVYFSSNLTPIASKTGVSLTFPSLINLRNESIYSISFLEYAGAECLPIIL